ncbi:MAG: PadR family transcriptional regulator [Gammaproteobacteria bacterium]
MTPRKPPDARTLMVLGLLQSGPRHGYELHRVLVAHGTLYADFKKPTLYHLLHRLTLQGAVLVNAEAGTRGRRGERLVFTLTPLGATLFQDLLRQALSTYDKVQTTFEVAAAYLPSLPAREAQALLRHRRRAIEAIQTEVVGEVDHLAGSPPGKALAARSLAADHAQCLLEAELAWLDRAMAHLASPAGRTTRLRRVPPPASRRAAS